jgi:hypothetical protein
MSSPSPTTQSQPHSQTWTSTDTYLRTQIGIPPGIRVDLQAIPSPPTPNEKPQQPLPILIKLAIHGSENGKLTLEEIYAVLEGRFEGLKGDDHDGWKVCFGLLLFFFFLVFSLDHGDFYI